jgi:hypothetical protein
MPGAAGPLGAEWVWQDHVQQNHGKNPNGTANNMVRTRPWSARVLAGLAAAPSRRHQIGTATCLPAGMAERYMATQPLSRAVEPAVLGGKQLSAANTVRRVRQVRLVRPHASLRNHRATGPAVPNARWSESRAILPYGRSHKATKWRGGREPPLAFLSPLGERLPHWGTVRADARRPCFALRYGRRSFDSAWRLRSSVTSPAR